ncbi:serine/threonine-protein kinase [Thiohalobacter sp. IOR34]|uniref:serine/threonine protein kinase n=1 Tax=Thiohalobacter sp. IOR34 TaxID=3057176 RepID=UPI0025B229C4|nr:serine/threonine-protein kinase [Thiohalobacter sp. IOR34]WJW75715.1 serine/threonine-protein kinase [Thiohalobacter sp. IOR34]
MLKKQKNALPDGTELDRYRIRHLLGGGGFSLVYLGTDRETGERVVIKEYMPGRLARRQPDLSVTPKDEAVANRFNRGRMLFFQEASALATLKHPNIVKVLSFFRANGTVYMVMDYQDGKNLQHYLTNRGGRLSERFLRTVFPPLLDGLEVIHDADLLHLDIKPGNIHIRPGGAPLLLDFGAVHGFPQSRQAQPGQVITAGFSPIEQYETGGYVGPWTDIYALGATMRACIEGRPPPPARQRHERDCMRPAQTQFRKRYSQGLLRAIDWAMEVDPLLRPQSVADFRKVLLADSPQPETPESPLDRLVSSLPWGRG